METKETSSQTKMHAVMLEDTEYFKYIFKKTEKIACAVFYILRRAGVVGQNDHVVYDVENAARELLDVSVASLRSTNVHIEEESLDLRHMLIRLESRLRIAHAARIVSGEFLEVFIHEIDSVQRSLRKYIDGGVSNPFDTALSTNEAPRAHRLSRARTEHQTNIASPRVEGVMGENRRDRVLGVLRDKGEATIKDIIEVVTDCSEKTIQRELISLIKDNIVHREGERRWSKYSLV